MVATCLHLTGFVASFVGWIGLIVATSTNDWVITCGYTITTCRKMDELGSKGLWADCVMATGLYHCKPLVDILILPVASKETRWCERTMAAALKLHFKKEGCQLGKKYVKTKLSHLHLDNMQEGEVKDRRESTSPKLSALNSPLSSSGNKATPGKCVIKKILVDLRPILDNIMDPLDSQEEMLEENPQDKTLQHPSSDPGDSSGEDFLEGEDGTSRLTTTDGGGNRTSKTAPVCSKDKGIHKVISFPSTPEPIRVSKFNGRRVKTPKGTPAELGEPKRPQKNISPAMLNLEPQFESPMFVPRICPQQYALLDTESSTELPRAPSPDLRLPTRLLLQRLQETTTSSNHLLITQVLSSLQEELLVRSPSSSDGEKQNSSSEASWNKPRKSDPADPNQGKETNGNPGATQRKLSKSTWCRHRFIYGAGLGRAAPHL